MYLQLQYAFIDISDQVMSNRKSMTERREYLMQQTGIVFAMGFAYFVISSLTGLYIPCLFRTLTGFKCPGCGVTHYAIAMIHGRLHEAFCANELIFVLMPAILLYAGYRALIYIRKGETGYSKAETTLLLIVLIITIAFGILRNIYL